MSCSAVWSRASTASASFSVLYLPTRTRNRAVEVPFYGIHDERRIAFGRQLLRQRISIPAISIGSHLHGKARARRIGRLSRGGWSRD